MRTAAFLEQYKLVAGQNVNSPYHDNYVRLAALNETLHSKAFLNQETDSRKNELLEAVEALKKMRYLANYGDYVKEECLQFRIAAKDNKAILKGAHYFIEGTTWNAVQKEMDCEKAELDRWHQNKMQGPKPSMDVTSAIEEACKVLKFGEAGVKHAIRLHAE